MRAVLIPLLLLPQLAQAGAWLRAQGELYVSVSHEGDPDGWTGIYAEYGAPRSLTLGLDVGGHVARGTGALFTGGDNDMDGRAIAFLRVPLPVANGRFPAWKVAGETGLGVDWDEGGDTVGRLRLGLSVGRPIRSPMGDGWVNLDTKVDLAASDPARFGVGAVIGTRFTALQALELGLFAEHEETSSAAFLPTYQITIDPLGDLRLGATIRFDGPTDLRLGIARTF